MKKTILNILEHTQEIVITSTFLTILYTRSIHMMYFTASAVASTLVAKVLKKLIKQPRPDSTTKKASYGMPSSHATAIIFFTSYLHWVVGLKAIPFHLFASAVVWSRVRLGHHTEAQVLIGSILGLTLATLSFQFWHHVLITYQTSLERILITYQTLLERIFLKKE